jgi:hypothetical protein
MKLCFALGSIGLPMMGTPPARANRLRPRVEVVSRRQPPRVKSPQRPRCRLVRTRPPPGNATASRHEKSRPLASSIRRRPQPAREGDG